MMEGISAIAGHITGGAAALVIIWRVIIWALKLMEGMRCQLRSEMTRTYYRHKDEKKIRQYEFENFKANYNAYRALHGNSFIVKINDEVDTWEILT